MKDAIKLKADIRKYAFWKFVRQAIGVIGLLSGVISVVWAFIAVGAIFFDTGLSQEALVVVSPLAAGITFCSIAARDLTKNTGAKYVDTRFSRKAYDLFLKSLRQRGVKRPTRFIINNPEHVTAYKAVLMTAYDKIDPRDHKETLLSRLGFWETAPRLIAEHKVAALILPGADELNRLPQIEHLINDRGIRTYSEIKTLVEQNGELPSVLTEGSL
jgi:hypothetical protein